VQISAAGKHAGCIFHFIGFSFLQPSLSQNALLASTTLFVSERPAGNCQQMVENKEG